MTSRASLKVLISGGGIAGGALAFWLTKLGHNVTVVEKYPGLRATGLQLDLRGAGIEVMKRMGLDEAFRAKRAPEEGIRIVDTTGRQRAWFPAVKPKAGQKQGFTSEYEIMRGDICHILHDAAVSNTTSAKYVFGTAVQSFEQRPDSIHVRLEDGTSDSYDLLVGADGQWSRTRRLMLAEGPEPIETGGADGMHRIPGLYFAYFTIKKPIQEGEKYVATCYLAPGRKGILTRRHSPTDLQVMLSCYNDSEAIQNIPRGDTAAEKEALAAIFRGAGWETDELLDAMMQAPDFYCERIGLVKLAPWSRGRVVLVGDAAHCPTVLTGMGTTSALIGAYILAGEIDRHDDLATALESYEARFRPFMDQVQKGVLESAAKQWSLAGTPTQIAILNWMLGVASFFARFVNFTSLFGTRETVKGWTLPDYEGLGDFRNPQDRV